MADFIIPGGLPISSFCHLGQPVQGVLLNDKYVMDDTEDKLM